VMEKLGIVYIWYHADKEPPQYTLEEVDEVCDEKNNFRFVTDIPWGPDWLMHVMEPSQNSADWYHFQTVHRYMANPVHPQLLKIDHTLKTYFSGGMSGGNGERDTEWEKREGIETLAPTKLVIRERIKRLSFLNLIDLPACIAAFFDVSVKIQGPQNVCFSIETGIGQFRGITSMTPHEPFRQRGRMRVFVNGWFPGWMARILANQITETANQDREVWEHKMHVAPRNLVAGDGPFMAYGNWLKQFYSESSMSMKDALQDSTDW